MLFSIVNDPVLSANDINHDLNIVQPWTYQWKMEFNPDPSKQATGILFPCKISTPDHPQLMFNGTVVTKVDEQKLLALILDPGLSFRKHLNEKMMKAKKNVGILKYLSKFLPLKTLDQMYKTLVRPHLDYYDLIYHIPPHQNQAPSGISPNSLMEKVGGNQYQAALAISGARSGSSRSKLYEELGWEPLQVHNILNNDPLLPKG